MAILVVYNILPVILLLVYLMKPFHKCLYKLKLNSVALNLFMDTFQGFYKDGTADTRDLRSFSCLYFLLRLFFILVRLLASASSYIVNSHTRCLPDVSKGFHFTATTHYSMLWDIIINSGSAGASQAKK